MKRTSSSSSSSIAHKKWATSIPEPERKSSKDQSPRNPLQDLNGISNFSSISTRSSQSSSTSSSLASVEAPRGCLRFLLSHSSSNTKTPFTRPLKPLSKTPKSAPVLCISRPPSKPKYAVSEKPILHKPQKFKKNPPCLYQWQNGKKPSSKKGHKPKPPSILGACGNSAANNVESGTQKLLHQENRLARIAGKLGEATELRLCVSVDSDGALTPMNKEAARSGSDYTVDNVMDGEKSNPGSKAKTPPIQASLSPEIQCGSSVVSTRTPACYGAGHILSGVTDKRKCRARGILTVGDNDLVEMKGFDNFNGDDNDEVNAVGVGNEPSKSIVPSPTEASMQWVLTPCNEEDKEEKENYENGSCRFQTIGMSTTTYSPPSTLSTLGFSSGDCKNSNKSSAATSGSRRRSSSLLTSGDVAEFPGFQESVLEDRLILSSLCAMPVCEAADLKQSKGKRKTLYDHDGESSPLESLGSGNVIQTPQSDSSSGRPYGLSWLSAQDHKEPHFNSLLDSVIEDLQTTSLSVNSHESIWDPTNASFQMDSLTTPSTSVDLSQFQKILSDRTSWISGSTSENVTQSQMRISWRDGLVSRIFEMDEFDICRCLSDEEENVNCCNSDLSKSHQSLDPIVADKKSLTNGSESSEFVDNKQGIDEKGKEMLPSLVPCSCAESISTDGGGLVRSEDSDWTLCYKNQLFDE